MTTYNTDAPKKPSFWKRYWPIGLAAIVGIGIGAVATPSPSEADPITVTEEVEVVKEVEVPDPTCREAAAELWSILGTAVNDVMLPYSDVTITLAGQLQYGADVATIQDATETVQGITATVEDLTARTDSIRPTYEECVS